MIIIPKLLDLMYMIHFYVLHFKILSLSEYLRNMLIKLIQIIKGLIEDKYCNLMWLSLTVIYILSSCTIINSKKLADNFFSLVFFHLPGYLSFTSYRNDFINFSFCLIYVRIIVFLTVSIIVVFVIFLEVFYSSLPVISFAYFVVIWPLEFTWVLSK